jgi:hypothetical protein
VEGRESGRGEGRGERGEGRGERGGEGEEEGGGEVPFITKFVKPRAPYSTAPLVEHRFQLRHYFHHMAC